MLNVSLMYSGIQVGVESSAGFHVKSRTSKNVCFVAMATDVLILVMSPLQITVSLDAIFPKESFQSLKVL